jgi:uncharacterized protein YkwD
MKPDREILQYKKDLFSKEVAKSAIALGVSIPKIKFWTHYEKHFDKDERAHIHLESKTICIANPELERMDEEDIKETASHEVSHLHYAGHGPRFKKTHENAKIGSWEPPSGTVGALPDDYVRKKNKSKTKIKSEKISKTKCFECGKKGKLHECKHCGHYYCENHKKSTRAGLPNFKLNSSENLQYMENLREGDGHPCIPYTRLKDIESKKESDEYGIALNRLLSSKKNKNYTTFNIASRELPSEEDDYYETIINSEEFKEYERKKKKKEEKKVKKENIVKNTEVNLDEKYISSIERKHSKRNKIKSKNKKSKHKKKRKSNVIIPILILFVLIALLIFSVNLKEVSSENVVYLDFVNELSSFREDNNASKISYDSDLEKLALRVSEELGSRQNNFISNDEVKELSNEPLIFDIDFITKKYSPGVNESLDFLYSYWTTSGIFSEKILNDKIDSAGIACSGEWCTVIFSHNKQETNIEEKPAEEEKEEKIEVIETKVEEESNYYIPEPSGTVKYGMNIDEVENEIFRLVNEERQSKGLRALSSKDSLNTFARSWSEKMILSNFFEHSNLDFYFPNIAAENIGETPKHYNVVGCGATYNEIKMARCFVDGWIGSPGHYENMMDKRFFWTGVGVDCDSSLCRATQVFSG